ncbi:arrestin domain-containing protein 1-like [Drosophila albomicans]|uniref:Arrestin domain-containing protein 1-like n=1 Tax=Drosophila albomicans TaxID=7291 RepID=A0A9C6T9P7_DROAB|nr:arrestin domain-containing protein 1-like [Drosophila albomicans]
MPTRCSVQFARDNSTFYSGEELKGQFVLCTTEEININSIYILLTGEGRVYPFENTSSPMVKGVESYLNTHVDCVGGRKLPAGTYNYSFNFMLPLRCPSSCEASIGSISYQISLVIDRHRHSDEVFKETINVIQPYNLNRYRDLKIPIENEYIKSLCCWPFSSGPVSLSLTIPFGGYVPGEKINCTVCIDNQAVGDDLHNVQLSLKQIMRFSTTAPEGFSREREHEYLLTSCILTECVNRLSKRLLNGSLQVPSVPPSTRKRQIIEIRYVVTISMKHGYCSNWNIDTPIVIGTKSLMKSIQIPITETAPIAETEWEPQTPDTPAETTEPSAQSLDNCETNTLEMNNVNP